MPRPDPQDQWQTGFEGASGALRGAQGLQSGFSGINTAGDIRSRYGLGTSTASVYDPLRRNLGASRGSALARASARSGGSATPGSSLFNPIESAFAGQEENLASQQGQSELGQQDFIANLLQSAMGSQDQFNLQKQGLIGSLSQGLMGGSLAKRQADYSQQDPQFMQYLMQLLGSASGPVTAALKG